MKRKTQLALGFALAGLILWWLFREIKWDQLFATLQAVNPYWLLLSQVPIIASFFTRVQRWSYIVRSGAPASFRAMFSATQIAFLANFTLPARIGELIRPFILGRLSNIPYSKGLAMSTLDRICDLIGLIAVMVVTLLAYRPIDVVVPAEVLPWDEPLRIPDTLVQNGTLGVLVLVTALIACLVLLYLNQRLALRMSDAVLGLVSAKLAQKVRQMVLHFSEGLRIFHSARAMLKAIAFSLITWGLFMIAAVCVFEAFHLDYPWYGPFVVQTVMALVTGIPGPPGFIGQFQASVMAGLILVMPAIPYETALAIGLVVHLINFIPIAATGIFCLLRDNMNLFELQRATEQAQETVPDPAPQSESL